jgi:glucose-6-phosphate isomerase
VPREPEDTTTARYRSADRPAKKPRLRDRENFVRLPSMAADAPGVHVDYTLAMRAGLGHEAGLTDAELDACADAVRAAIERVRRRVDAGELGFWRLPCDRDAAGAVQRIAARCADFDDVLVLGIGGSSLGARALVEALGTAAPGVPARRGRLHFPDNSDPWLLSVLLAHLNPARTGVLVVSKSGATIETAAQAHVVTRWLAERLGEAQARGRVIAVTDPQRGSLRERATRDGWESLPIPANVGGRFSVLTAAGLLPAAIAGIDVVAVLDGAAAMAARCEGGELRSNPAAALACVHVLHHQLRGRSVHVMMPYADRLRAFAMWYVQLWAESLGKRVATDGRVVETGPTPVPAVGSTDQHAQVQLFVEGPRDKLVTFVAVEEPACDLPIPAGPDAPRQLAGRTLGALLRAQRVATSEALAADGRPSITVHLRQLDAHAFGALLFLYQAATAFAGELYGVDAFNQPGVELGKRLTDALLDADGADAATARLRALRAGRPTGYSV